MKVAEQYANELHADLAIVHKRRVKGAKNGVEARDVVGDVEGRCCVLIDDMIDTAGTIVRRRRAADGARGRRGPRRLPPTACSPARPSTGSRTRASAGSSSPTPCPLPSEKQFDKLEVLSIAPILAKAIDAVFEDTSRLRALRRQEPDLTGSAGESGSAVDGSYNRRGRPQPRRCSAGPRSGRPSLTVLRHAAGARHGR